MPAFSSSSRNKLNTCDPRIVEIMEEVIKHYDCTILEGKRSKEVQDECFRTGNSRVEWPNSKHNCPNGGLSLAIDVVPYPIDWNDTDRFYHFGGFVNGIATSMGYKIRWGFDWDMDNDFKDQTFMDGAHFELAD